MSDGAERSETSGFPLPEPISPVSDEIAAADIQRDEQLAGASNSEIDREVAEAFAEMSEADRAELGGEVITGEDVAPGAEITGRVVSVSDDDIFMEFGAKSQGVLPRSQFGKKEEVEVGRRIDVVVERFDPETSLLIVNRKGAIQRATWTTLAVGAIVEGKVTGVIKGGLELDLKGIRAFMPGSQVDIAPMKDISVLLNEKVRCEVLELDRRAKNVLVSRRKLMERDRAQAKEKLLAELEVGQVRSGIVKTIMEYGAFVDLGGVDGLAHIRDLSWGSVDKVSDVLSPGQEVEVQVLKIDSARERISLSVKHCQPDPWTEAETRFPVGSSHKARILRLASFGAFAELDKGIEGLIPMSEMGWNRLRSSSEAVSVGDVVDTVVIRLELEKHRLALSMKQAQPDPWEGVLDSYSAQSLVRGKVTRLAEFGAFVELAPGVEGLIHISELAEGRVKSCGAVVKTGEEVEARVLSVDKENRRISLSIKAVHSAASAEDAATPAHKDAEQAKPKKRKKKLRGGLSSHFDW